MKEYFLHNSTRTEKLESNEKTNPCKKETQQQDLADREGKWRGLVYIHPSITLLHEWCERTVLSLWDWLTRESSATKDLRAMVRSNSGASQQHARTESRPTASSAAVKGALPGGRESRLSTWAHMRPRLQHCIWFGTPQYKKHLSELGWAQQRGTRLVLEELPHERPCFPAAWILLAGHGKLYSTEIKGL